MRPLIPTDELHWRYARSKTDLACARVIQVRVAHRRTGDSRAFTPPRTLPAVMISAKHDEVLRIQALQSVQRSGHRVAHSPRLALSGSPGLCESIVASAGGFVVSPTDVPPAAVALVELGPCVSDPAEHADGRVSVSSIAPWSAEADAGSAGMHTGSSGILPAAPPLPLSVSNTFLSGVSSGAFVRLPTGHILPRCIKRKFYGAGAAFHASQVAGLQQPVVPLPIANPVAVATAAAAPGFIPGVAALARLIGGPTHGPGLMSHSASSAGFGNLPAAIGPDAAHGVALQHPETPAAYSFFVGGGPKARVLFSCVRLASDLLVPAQKLPQQLARTDRPTACEAYDAAAPMHPEALVPLCSSPVAASSPPARNEPTGFGIGAGDNLGALPVAHQEAQQLKRRPELRPPQQQQSGLAAISTRRPAAAHLHAGISSSRWDSDTRPSPGLRVVQRLGSNVLTAAPTLAEALAKGAIVREATSAVGIAPQASEMIVDLCSDSSEAGEPDGDECNLGFKGVSSDPEQHSPLPLPPASDPRHPQHSTTPQELREDRWGHALHSSPRVVKSTRAAAMPMSPLPVRVVLDPQQLERSPSVHDKQALHSSSPAVAARNSFEALCNEPVQPVGTAKRAPLRTFAAASPQSASKLIARVLRRTLGALREALGGEGFGALTVRQLCSRLQEGGEKGGAGGRCITAAAALGEDACVALRAVNFEDKRVRAQVRLVAEALLLQSDDPGPATSTAAAPPPLRAGPAADAAPVAASSAESMWDIDTQEATEEPPVDAAAEPLCEPAPKSSRLPVAGSKRARVSADRPHSPQGLAVVVAAIPPGGASQSSSPEVVVPRRRGTAAAALPRAPSPAALAAPLGTSDTSESDSSHVLIRPRGRPALGLAPSPSSSSSSSHSSGAIPKQPVRGARPVDAAEARARYLAIDADVTDDEGTQASGDNPRRPAARVAHDDEDELDARPDVDDYDMQDSFINDGTPARSSGSSPGNAHNPESGESGVIGTRRRRRATSPDSREHLEPQHYHRASIMMSQLPAAGTDCDPLARIGIRGRRRRLVADSSAHGNPAGVPPPSRRAPTLLAALLEHVNAGHSIDEDDSVIGSSLDDRNTSDEEGDSEEVASELPPDDEDVPVALTARSAMGMGARKAGIHQQNKRRRRLGKDGYRGTQDTQTDAESDGDVRDPYRRIVHDGFSCDSCGVEPIQGVRHHCVQCDNYDLCAACAAFQGNLHPDHAFAAIRVATVAPSSSSGDEEPRSEVLLAASLPRPLSRAQVPHGVPSRNDEQRRSYNSAPPTPARPPQSHSFSAGGSLVNPSRSAPPAVPSVAVAVIAAPTASASAPRVVPQSHAQSLQGAAAEGLFGRPCHPGPGEQTLGASGASSRGAAAAMAGSTSEQRLAAERRRMEALARLHARGLQVPPSGLTMAPSAKSTLLPASLGVSCNAAGRSTSAVAGSQRPGMPMSPTKQLPRQLTMQPLIAAAQEMDAKEHPGMRQPPPRPMATAASQRPNPLHPAHGMHPGFIAPVPSATATPLPPPGPTPGTLQQPHASVAPVADPRMLEARTRLLCSIPCMPEVFAAALVRWVGTRPLKPSIAGLSAATAAALPAVAVANLAPGTIVTLLEACKAKLSLMP